MKSYVCLPLTYLSIMPSRSIHVVTNGKMPSFYYWVILHCMYVIYIYMCLCVYIYIHHIFFIHLSVDRHLGCFRILDTVRNAVMIGKWRCRYHFRLVFSYSLDKCPGVGKLDHMVVLFLIFWGIFIQSSSHCINLHFHQ